jgi:[ribosomal protein S5]-alanine N-acetyltransferase
MSIHTSRLFIKPLSIEDKHFIFELLNTKSWIKYIGNRNINSVSDAVAYIHNVIRNPEIDYWTVILKENKNPIGLITLIKRSYLEFKDIGFAFLPKFTNKGYAFEATSAFLQNLANNKSEEYLLAIILPNNEAAGKLIEKLGFTYQKTITNDNETLSLYFAKMDFE